MPAADSENEDDFCLMVRVKQKSSSFSESELMRADQCGQCLLGKAAALEMFVAYTRRLTRTEKKVCIFTALSVFYVAPEARPSRVRSTGERIRFHYFLPFVGRVCRSAFLKCFNVSAPTIARYRRLIRDGSVLDEYEDEL